MKSVYLKDEHYNWKKFTYDGDIRESLGGELKKRGITIGDGAIIGYCASIGVGATIGEDATIGYRASIGDRAIIGDGAIIGDRAIIGVGATIGGGAIIGYRAIIGDRAIIGYDARLITAFYVNGSKHPVTYCGNGMVSIGCHCLSIQQWEENGLEIAKYQEYDDDAIEEYRHYIEAIKLIYQL